MKHYIRCFSVKFKTVYIILVQNWGHVDPGEDEWTAALRETREEAGIAADCLDVHKDFVEVLQYEVKQSRYGQEVTKQVAIWCGPLAKYFSVVHYL